MKSFRILAAALLGCALTLSCKKDVPVTQVAAPDTYDVSIVEFSTSRGSFHIGGKLYLPNGLEGRKPAAIMCHGLFGSFINMEPYAKTAAKMGIVAVCFDFCGGPPGQSLSDGDIAKDNSVLTELEDVTAVYEAIAARSDVDPSRIVLMGESQGGLVSALFAAKHPSRVKALALIYPAFNLPDYVRTAVDTFFGGDPGKVPEEGLGIKLGDNNFTFSRKYVLDAYDIEPFKVIGQYEGMVKIVHGDKDIVVPLDYSLEALKIYKNAHLDTIHGQGHIFDQGGISQATTILQNWFPKVL